MAQKSTVQNKVQDRHRRQLFEFYLEELRSDANRERLFAKIAEKYLAWSLSIHGARGDDMATFVLDCATVFRQGWDNLLADYQVDAKLLRKDIATLGGFKPRVGSASTALFVGDMGGGIELRSLRSFEGALDALLEGVTQKMSRSSAGDKLTPNVGRVLLLIVIILAAMKIRRLAEEW